MRCALLLISMFTISKVRIADHRPPVIFSFFLFSYRGSLRKIEKSLEMRCKIRRRGPLKPFPSSGTTLRCAQKEQTRQRQDKRTPKEPRRQMFLLNLYFSSLLPLLWNYAAPCRIPTGSAIYLTDRNSPSHAMRTSATGGRDGARV